jgi:hypothetical protein
MCDLEKQLMNELNSSVDIYRFRKNMLNEWLNFKMYKTLEPSIDKKAQEYWKYISMAFFNDPNKIATENPKAELTQKSIDLLNKLNDIDDILKKVIIMSNEKYIRYFNVLTEKNVSLQSLTVAIRNLGE